MTYLTPSRDALAEALHADAPLTLDQAGDAADALIASGAVIDATTLTDDNALVAAVASGCLDGLHLTEWGPRYTPTEGAHAALRALAAALTEKSTR